MFLAIALNRKHREDVILVPGTLQAFHLDTALGGFLLAEQVKGDSSHHRQVFVGMVFAHPALIFVEGHIQQTIEVNWLPTYASWLDQIEIWFSVLQRKLLQPGDFASLEELTQAILEFVKCGDLSAKLVQWTYTVEKLERKLRMIL